MAVFLSRHTELIIWVSALAVLASTDPLAPAAIELCVFKWAGVNCPGCGLGHGIAYLLDLNFQSAIAAHPLSPFVLAAMFGRVTRLAPRLLTHDTAPRQSYPRTQYV